MNEYIKADKGFKARFVHSHSNCLYCCIDFIIGIVFLGSSFNIFNLFL